MRQEVLSAHWRRAMRQIEAIIDQFRLQDVRNALLEMGIEDFMETTIRCHRKGQTMMFRGATFVATIVEKVKLEIIAADDAVAGITETISAVTLPGRREECRIAIRPYPVSD